MTRSIVFRSLLAACALAAASQLQAQSKPLRASDAPPTRTLKPTKETADIRAPLEKAMKLLQADEVSEESRAKAREMLQAALTQLARGDYDKARFIYRTAKNANPDQSREWAAVIQGATDESAKDRLLARLKLEPDAAVDLLGFYSRVEGDKKELAEHKKELTDRKRALERDAATLAERAHALHVLEGAAAAHAEHGQDPKKLPEARRKTQTVVEWVTDKKQTAADKKKVEAALQEALEYVDRKQTATDIERSNALRKVEKEYDVLVTKMTKAKAAKADRDAEVEYRIRLDKDHQEADKVRAEVVKSLVRTDPAVTDKAGNVYFGTIVDSAGRIVGAQKKSGDDGAIRVVRRLPAPKAEDDDGEIVEALNGIRAELRAIRNLMERAHGAMDDDDHDHGEAEGALSRRPDFWVERSRAGNAPKGGVFVRRVRENEDEDEEDKGEGSNRYYFDVKVDTRKEGEGSNRYLKFDTRTEGEGARIELEPDFRRKIEKVRLRAPRDFELLRETSTGTNGWSTPFVAEPVEVEIETRSAPKAGSGFGGGGIGMDVPAEKATRTKAGSAPNAAIGIGGGAGGRFRVIKETAPEPTKATVKRRYIR